jgi:hypothetical protein
MRIINPLLEVVLRQGGVPETMPWRENVLISDPVAIAELFRIFDLLMKPELPELKDAFEGAIKAFDVRSSGAIEKAS